MKRKDILERRQQRLIAKRKKLVERSQASEDVNEVRSINEQLKDLADELQDISDELKVLADEENGNGEESGEPSSDPSGSDSSKDEGEESQSTNTRNASIVGAFGQSQVNPTQKGMQTRTAADVLASMEYRKAFMKYLQTGEWSYRGASDGMITTGDVGKVIPKTIMDEFVRELKVYGQLYNRVRKLNVRGGVEFPIEELVPTVSWISETTPSKGQSAPQINTSVSFGYYICEARIAQSLLSQIVSLDVLESEIARILAEAFIKEFDNMIINGSGSGQPTGILNDSRVAAGQKIDFLETDVADWTSWRKKLFSKIPLAYRGQGILVMTAATWESQIMTMKDANDRPVYAEAYDPQTGETTCRFAGREVVLVEPDILKDFDTAKKGDAFAVYFKPTDYAINSNLQLGFQRYFDNDNNKWVNKGLCVVDGKLLDTKGAFILKKTTA